MAFGILNAISFFFSLALYIDNRKIILFKLNCLYWASMVILFLAQGVFGHTETGIIASFCFTPLYVFVLALVTQELFKINLPTIIYKFMLLAGVICTIVYCSLGFSFFISSLPISLTSGLVLLHTSLSAYSKNKDKQISMTGKLFILIVLICGLHVFDFPLLRKNEDFALIGFYIAFLLAIFMSVILPYFIAEETQKNYLLDLEKEVAIKTVELNEANGKLNKVATERQDLILLICHDLNNHLMIQLHFNEYLAELAMKHNFSSLDEKFEIKLGRSQNVLETQRNLTAKINLMSSIDTGKVDVQITNVNLLEALRTNLDLLQTKISDKEIKVTYSCSDALEILADKTLLVNSIMNNIMINAIKFSKNGGSLQIKAISSGDEIWLIIKDYGIGISKSQIADLFSRTKVTTTCGTNGETGTGFGMLIVESMLKKIGGKIDVRSCYNPDFSGSGGTAVCMFFKNAKLKS